MSEVGEISQHELASKKTKSEHGEVAHNETVLRWTHEGAKSSAQLTNKSKNRNRQPWATVGKAAYAENNTESIYGMHPILNSGRSDEAFFYIKKIAQENLEPYIKPTEIQESSPLTFSPNGESIDMWNKKNRLYDMCARSGEEPFVAMHLEGDTLSIAHKGDYRAVLGQEGKAKLVTAYEEEATVTEHTLPKGESQLILGSDGLWDFMSPEEAAQIIAQIQNPEEASILLREEAYKRAQLKNGTVRDISVMVMNLNAPENKVRFLDTLRQRKAARRYGRGFPKAA